MSDNDWLTCDTVEAAELLTKARREGLKLEKQYYFFGRGWGDDEYDVLYMTENQRIRLKQRGLHPAWKPLDPDNDSKYPMLIARNGERGQVATFYGTHIEALRFGWTHWCDGVNTVVQLWADDDDA